MAALSAGAVLAAPEVQAASYHLNFDYSGLNNEGEALNTHLLDGAGQTINGVLYSTTEGNIGDIWKSYGITITGDPARRRTDPLGLFNSNCTTGHAGNNNFDADRCEQRIDGTTYGDNDLATGSAFGTASQGNLLIFEENEGNGAPDDTIPGGEFYFDIAEDKHWTVEEIGFVDDARGSITYTYRDGTSDTEVFDIPGENQLEFFTGAQDKLISQIAVTFNSSGGITGLKFQEETPIASVPEPAAGLGLVVFGAIASRLKRKQQVAEA